MKKALFLLLSLSVIFSCKAQWTLMSQLFDGSYTVTIKAINGTLYVGTGNGSIYKSADGGNTWIQLIDNVPTADIATIGSTIFAAGPGLVKSINGGAWTQVFSGPEYYHVITKDSVVIVGTQDGEVYQSRDLLQTWTQVNNPATFCYGIDDLIADSTHIFAATCSTFVSTNDGDTWSLAGPGGSNHLIKKGPFLFRSCFANSLGNVFRSPDDGATWTSVATNNTSYSDCFVVSGSNLLIGYNSPPYCLYTPDNGQNWYPADGGLTSQVNSMATLGGVIFAATTTGLFRLDTSMVSSVGLKEKSSSSPIAVFPNPCNDILKIRAESTKDLQVKLYDINSRMILQKCISEDSEVDLEQVEKGLYIYELSDATGFLQRGKICKE